MTIQEFQQLLYDKEVRASRIQSIITSTHLPLIELTLNIPGTEKQNPKFYLLHRYLENLVRQVFDSHSIVITHQYHEYLSSGSCALLSFCPTPLNQNISSIENFCIEVKSFMVAIEESEPLGRLFDIDVFYPDGKKLQRSSGLRRCLLCGNKALVCARSGAHPIKELSVEIERLMDESVGFQQFIEFPIAPIGTHTTQLPLLFKYIAQIAQKAMMGEVLLTPKPGLVDKNNSGSHHDMDYFTFSATTCALGNTFQKMIKAGYDADQDCRSDLMKLLPILRVIGLEGEKAMFAASQGVNTQKGLIFSIGLILGAMGVFLKDKKISPDILPTGSLFLEHDLRIITQYVREICKGMVERELTTKIENNLLRTYGEKLHANSGVQGARGEGEAGFPSAFHAYEMLNYLLTTKGTQYYQNFEKSALQTLMVVMSDIIDTNVLGRHGWNSLLDMHNKVQQYLKQGGVGNDVGMEGLKNLDTEFIIQNISPGGAADTLATALFFYYLTVPL